MFDRYEQISYTFKINSKDVERILTDLSTSIKISFDTVQNFGFYDFYIIQDGDTPEKISNKIYGNVKYYYLIMLVNDRFNWKTDWPLTDDQLISMCDEKYTNKDNVHHYQRLSGEIIVPEYDSTKERAQRFVSIEDQIYVNKDKKILAANIIPITNYEFEQSENEKKRHIKLIKPQYIQQLDTAIRGLL